MTLLHARAHCNCADMVDVKTVSHYLHAPCAVLLEHCSHKLLLGLLDRRMMNPPSEMSGMLLSNSMSKRNFAHRVS